MAIYRSRRHIQPKVPATPEDLILALSDPQATAYNQYFKGHVAADGQTAVILFSDLVRSKLHEVSEAFYDGTFFCVPSLYEQLFTISGVLRGQALPLIHVLMTGRKEALYSAVLEKIISLVPAFSPTFWMGNFEAPSRQAIQTWFPGSRVAGCHFHFSRAVFKKLQKLGLGPVFKSNPEVKLFVKQLMAVAFLPPHEIQNAIESLFSQVLSLELSPHTNQGLRKLKSYMTRFWLTVVSSSVLSVYDVSHTTNNISESYHSRLKSIVRTHRPAVWSFLAHINNLIADTDQEVRRLDEGLALQRKHKKCYQANQAKRELCKAKLVSGHYTPLEYVRAISHTFDSSLRTLERGPGDDRLDLGTNDEEEPAQDAPAPQEGQVHQEVNQAQGDQVPRSTVCVICHGPRDNPVLYLPCRHALVCGNCDAHFTVQSPCPFCRSPVEQKIQNIFL